MKIQRDYFYTTKQIAKLFKVSEETVRRWARDGKLKRRDGFNVKKTGNMYLGEEILKFSKEHPKYSIDEYHPTLKERKDQLVDMNGSLVEHLIMLATKVEELESRISYLENKIEGCD